jgi:hypothetical protein
LDVDANEEEGENGRANFALFFPLSKLKPENNFFLYVKFFQGFGKHVTFLKAY